MEGSRQSSMQGLDYNRKQWVRRCPRKDHMSYHTKWAHIDPQRNRAGPCSRGQYEKEHGGFIPKVLTKHSIMTRLKQNHVQHSKPGLKNRRFYWREVFLKISTALSLYLLEDSAPTGFLHGDSRLCEQQRHRLDKIHSCLQMYSMSWGQWACYFTLLFPSYLEILG